MAIIKPNNNTISAITALPASISTGRVLQTIHTDNVTRSQMSSNSFATISGQSVTITPSSSSNKILIINTIMTGMNSGQYGFFQFFRNTTKRNSTNNDGSRIGCSFTFGNIGYDEKVIPINSHFLDSPSSTSELVYTIKAASWNNTTMTFNKSVNDSDQVYTARPVSNITAMEIKG